MCSRLVLLCCAETQCEFGMWYECDACARDERAQKRAEEAEESEEGSRGQISCALASVSSMLLCILNCSLHVHVDEDKMVFLLQLLVRCSPASRLRSGMSLRSGTTSLRFIRSLACVCVFFCWPRLHNC